jgi:flagella basal body P-ring formation protein FlgA
MTRKPTRKMPGKLTPPLLLSLAALAAAAAPARAGDTPAAVQHGLEAALVIPGARLTVRSYRPTAAAAGCAISEATVDKPIEASGRYPVKVNGRGCGGWAWADVVVKADVLVTTRPVRPGESLDGATTRVERELRPGREPASGADAGELARARATRPLGRGQLVERSHVEAAGAAAGSPVKVIIRAGDLTITQTGRLVACGRGRSCAVVPSGKRLEGTLADGQLLVEAP